MKIHWQGDGWYAAIDPAAESLEMVKIGKSDLTHGEAQALAKEQGYTTAAFYIDPPHKAVVITE
jgi:hypothetical protein